MKHTLKTKLFILFGLLLLLFGCTEVEITGRKQFNIVPDSTMNSMSFQSYGEFLSKHKLSTNTEQTQMVKRIGGRIQNAVEQYCKTNNIDDRLEGYEWEFNLIEDPNVNAWCMPGGKVVVYTGILPVAQGETALAVVIGHEIAHAFAKHGAERMSQTVSAPRSVCSFPTAGLMKKRQTIWAWFLWRWQDIILKRPSVSGREWLHKRKAPNHRNF
jgi:predicted Zn-dependent protease